MGILSNKEQLLRRLTGILAILTVASPFAVGETRPAAAVPETPPEPRELKADLRAELLTAAIPEVKAYRENLLSLEKKLASAEDFAGALRARDERTKLESTLMSLEHEAAILAARPSRATAARLAARLEFKLSDAKLTSAKFDAKDGAITGLDQVNASATWQLPFLPAGGYEVLLRCTGAPGEVVVKEGFYSLTSTCQGTKDKAVEQNLGTLRIRAGGGTLTLGAAHAEKGAAWRVYSLVLVPPAT